MGKSEIPIEGEGVEAGGASIEQGGEKECADGGENGRGEANPERETERNPELSARCAL